MTQKPSGEEYNSMRGLYAIIMWLIDHMFVQKTSGAHACQSVTCKKNEYYDKAASRQNTIQYIFYEYISNLYVGLPWIRSFFEW